MAGKLTPEQKAINKEATRLRNRAFNARKDAYRAELLALENKLNASPAAEEVLAAEQALNAALVARDDAINCILTKIEELKHTLDITKAEHDAIIEPLLQTRSLAWDKKRTVQQESNQLIRHKYPDVVDCYSAAAWKPIEEFIPLVAK